MRSTIMRVRHRHPDQSETEADLVVEVGKAAPNYYQRRGAKVTKITEDPRLITCFLDDGSPIYINENMVLGID